MKKIILFLACVLSACGNQDGKFDCTNPDFTAAGVKVCLIDDDLDVTPQEIENHVETLEAVLHQVYGDEVINKSFSKELEKRNTRIIFVKDGNLAVNCEKVSSGVQLCEGVALGVTVSQDKIKIIVRYHSGCTAKTSLAHELGHAAEIIYFGGAQADHTTDKMFDDYAREHSKSLDYSYTETVEYITETTLKEAWCILNT